MKKIILLIAVGILSLSLTSYAGRGYREIRKDLKVSLNPTKIQLVENNGVIGIQFKISVPKNYVKSKHQYLFTPVLTDYHNAMPLTSVVINGERYAKMAAKKGHSKKMKEKMQSAPDMADAIQLMNSKNSRVIDYDIFVPFQPWMQNADLVTVQRFNSKKSTILIAEDIYGRGVTVPVPEPVNSMTDVLKVVNKMEGKVNINFLINSSQIDMTLDNNIRELYNLKKIINDVMSDKKNMVDSLVIIASSSPDGSYAFNKKLAEARANSVKNYLVKDMGLNSQMIEKIKVHYIAENWDGLERLVNVSDVTNKAGIIKAITIADLAKRERAMMALPQYNYLKKYILPQLRFVKYQIFYHTTNVKTTTVTAPVAPQPQQMAPVNNPQTMQPMNNNAPQRVVMKDKHKKHRNVVEMKDKVSPHYVRYHR